MHTIKTAISKPRGRLEFLEQRHQLEENKNDCFFSGH